MGCFPPLLRKHRPRLGNGEFSAGLQAFQNGDYMAALKTWRPLAERGDTAAQYSIGFMYQTGKGLPQSYADAARCYRLAAEHGHLDAQRKLAALYETLPSFNRYAYVRGDPVNHNDPSGRRRER